MIKNITNQNCIIIESIADIEKYISQGLILTELYDFTFMIRDIPEHDFKDTEPLINWLNTVPRQTFILWEGVFKHGNKVSWHLFFQRQDAFAAKLTWK